MSTVIYFLLYYKFNLHGYSVGLHDQGFMPLNSLMCSTLKMMKKITI